MDNGPEIGGRSLLGVYKNRLIGTTINDTGLNCPFGGSHVHEDDVGVDGAVTTTRHTSLYPTGASCHTTCGTFKNDNINNWTRKFSWNEGA